MLLKKKMPSSLASAWTIFRATDNASRKSLGHTVCPPYAKAHKWAFIAASVRPSSGVTFSPRMGWVLVKGEIPKWTDNMWKEIVRCPFFIRYGNATWVLPGNGCRNSGSEWPPECSGLHVCVQGGSNQTNPMCGQRGYACMESSLSLTISGIACFILSRLKIIAKLLVLFRLISKCYVFEHPEFARKIVRKFALSRAMDNG